MNIPLCRMIFVPRGRPTLKIDTLKMEHAFQMTRFFTSLPQTNKGRKHLQTLMKRGWDEHRKGIDDEFEVFFTRDSDLCEFSRCMFHVQDENYHFQEWMPFIIQVHLEDAFWHICVDSILLDITKGLVELLSTMIELNQ